VKNFRKTTSIKLHLFIVKTIKVFFKIDLKIVKINKILKGKNVIIKAINIATNAKIIFLNQNLL